MSGTLEPSQVAHYRCNGYFSPVTVMAVDQASKFLARYEKFRTRDGADRILRTKPHLVLPWLYDLVRDPAVTEPVSSILGPNLLAWGSSFFSKHAGDPGYVSWHQDANYWGLKPHDVLTAWIAFSPSRRENGCMRVVPGSHLGKALPHEDTFAANNLLSRGQEIAVEVDESKAQEITLEPGEMSLHHVGTVHGSKPNTSDIPRIGYAIRYIATNVRQIGVRTSATLAAGVDEYGHFETEPRPMKECDEAGLAFRHRALAQIQKVLYASAGSEGGKTRVSVAVEEG